MNISEVVYKETEVLQKLVPFGRVGDVSASLGRIEAAVNKRIAELEQEADDAFEEGYTLGVSRQTERAREKDEQMVDLQASIEKRDNKIAELGWKLDLLKEWKEDRETWVKRFERAIENKEEK